MRSVIVSQDHSLLEVFRDNKAFIDVRLDRDAKSKISNCDIIVIDQENTNITHDIEHDANQVFIIQSKDDESKSSEDENIHYIDSNLSNEEIVKYVREHMNDDNRVFNKFYTFFGASNEVGTTMITQCVAEILSQHLNVIVINASGDTGTEYVKEEIKHNLEHVKLTLASRVFSKEDLDQITHTIKDNYSIIKGGMDVTKRRYYHPQDLFFLYDFVGQYYDVVLIDAGHNYDTAFTLSGVEHTKKRYLIATQQEKVLNTYLNDYKHVLSRSSVGNLKLIINKYLDQRQLNNKFSLQDKYNATCIATVPYLDYGWQCEMEKQNLLKYSDNEFEESILSVVKDILHDYGINITEQKESLWEKLFKKKG